MKDPIRAKRHERPAVSLIATTLAITLAACSGSGGTSSAAMPTGSVPIVTPSSAYTPFPLSNAAQRATFEAFIRCARDHGIEYEGPFTDSTGKSMFFKAAPGQTPSQRDRTAVESSCPQNIVGSFGTPIGPVNGKLFEHAAIAFSRCVRSRGIPGFPLATFDGGDPVRVFWQLPFDWSNPRFVSAANACLEPLRSYLFSSS